MLLDIEYLCVLGDGGGGEAAGFTMRQTTFKIIAVLYENTRFYWYLLNHLKTKYNLKCKDPYPAVNTSRLFNNHKTINAV
jgi:hypothetical protein